MSEIRLDYGRLRKAKRTPQGGIRVPALVTRTGVFTYTRPDGSTVRELRHPDDVFHRDSLQSLEDAVVTSGHPASLVDSTTWKEHAVGYVRGTATRADTRVSAEVVIQDADEIERIESGAHKEVSCGYRCDFDERSGNYMGEAYDRRQTGIFYNHVALGPEGWGRAGRDVALRLDSGSCRLGVATEESPYTWNAERDKGKPVGKPLARADASSPAPPPPQYKPFTRESPAQKKPTGVTMQLPQVELGDGGVRIDGVDYSLGTEHARAQARQALKAALDRVPASARFDSENQAVNDTLQSFATAVIKSQEELLSLACKHAAEPAPAAAEVDAATLDSLVQSRTALLSHASTIAPEAKFDGLSDRDVMLAALRGRDADIKLDGKSDDYVRGLFEASGPARNDSVDEARKALLREPETKMDARETRREALRNAWKTPLSASSERITQERGL